MRQPQINCHACYAIDWQHFRQFQDYNLWQCQTCHLIILYPQPTATELESLYEQKYFTQHLKAQMPQSRENIDKEIQKRYHFVNWLEMICNRPGGKILEIGCATGFLLKALQQRGWEVRGLEISEVAANYARTMLQLDVITGQMDEHILGTDRFDIILMLHTFEHLPDPRQTLQQLRNHFKDQGLMVIQVPNARSIEARLLRQHWQGWRIPYHLFHFSPRSLKRLLTACGYTIIFREFALPTIEQKILEKIMHRPATLPGTVAATAAKARIFRFRKWLLHLNKSLPIGRDITVIASKLENQIKE